MEIGEYIDKYIITEVMHGGMSEVYRVAIEGAPIRFVLKRLKKDANDEQRKLFCREMRILQKLKHLYIIEVLEEHYDGECPYYVMPSCGKSFVDIASSSDDYYKLVLTMQMCEGLEYMHNNGVRHRDIKPQNILIKDDIVKIADFGLSRFWDRDSTTLTATSLAAGTQGYMPPEYSSGGFKEGTVQGDIYMLGKTIYFLFSHGGDVSNASQYVDLRYVLGDTACTVSTLSCCRKAEREISEEFGKIYSRFAAGTITEGEYLSLYDRISEKFFRIYSEAFREYTGRSAPVSTM